MKLNFGERFALLSVLPVEDNYANLRIAWMARMIIAPSTEEFAEFNIKQEGANIVWDFEKAKEYSPDIPLDDAMITQIRRKLIDLDRESKLNGNTYSLFEKFVLAYQQM